MALTAVIPARYTDESNNTSKFPNDGGDGCGMSSSVAFRVGHKFYIGMIPPGSTILNVMLDVNITAVSGAGSLLWDIDGYNGTGQGDPEADSAATFFTGCNVTGVYVNDTTLFRTTGVKNFADLGQTARDDLATARLNGQINFSIGYRITVESGTTNLCTMAEWTHATPPVLTVTYVPLNSIASPANAIRIDE